MWHSLITRLWSNLWKTKTLLFFWPKYSSGNQKSRLQVSYRVIFNHSVAASRHVWLCPAGSTIHLSLRPPKPSREPCRETLDFPWCMEVSQRALKPHQAALTAWGCYTLQSQRSNKNTQCKLLRSLVVVFALFYDLQVSRMIIYLSVRYR